MRRPVTIRDVAAAAEVSVGTASKALNGQGNLRAETRERVSQAAQRLGFVPNAVARALLTGRSFSVGLVGADSFDWCGLQVLLGAADELGAARVSSFVCETGGDSARERRHMETLSTRQADGLLVIGREAAPAPAVVTCLDVPVVYAMTRPSGGAAAVVPDFEGGGRVATEHLLAIGRRRIAHVTGPEHSHAARLRARGFRTAMAVAGAEPCNAVMHGQWSESWGREAAGQLLASRPDAIFCGSDQVARGAADTLRAVGRRIPDDVAVVGSGNWAPLALGALPPLTSVDMCFEEVGRVAATRLLAAIDGRQQSGVHTVASSLVVRESSR